MCDPMGQSPRRTASSLDVRTLRSPNRKATPTTPDHRSTCTHAPLRVAFGILKCVNIRNNNPIVAQWLACRLLCRRFSIALTYAHSTARGQCGSLHFHCGGLALVPCRAPSAPNREAPPTSEPCSRHSRERVLEIQQPHNQLDWKTPMSLAFFAGKHGVSADLISAHHGMSLNVVPRSGAETRPDASAPASNVAETPAVPCSC